MINPSTPKECVAGGPPMKPAAGPSTGCTGTAMGAKAQCSRHAITAVAKGRKPLAAAFAAGGAHFPGRPRGAGGSGAQLLGCLDIGGCA